MMSFDIKSLCTSIPLNKIRITLERKDQKEVNTDIPKTIKKGMYQGCSFLFEDEIYQQIDSLAMGSPLGPILAGIFMVELETATVPTLGNYYVNGKDM